MFRAKPNCPKWACRALGKSSLLQTLPPATPDVKSDGKWLPLCLMEHIPSCHNTLLFPFLPPHACSTARTQSTYTGWHLPATPHPPFSASQELQPRGTELCPTLSLLSASDFCCPTWEDNEVPPWPNQLKFSMLLGMQLMNLFLLQQPLPCSHFTGLLLLCVCLMKLMKLMYTDGCSLTQEGTSH